MRILALLLLLFICLNAVGQQKKKPPVYEKIRMVLTDINGDGKTDTIIISSFLKEKGFFNRISISLATFQRTTFHARDKWTAVDDTFLKTNKNDVASTLLFLKKTNKHAVILLSGAMDGAGYRGEFSIINIENNSVKMVFDHYDDNVDVEVPETLTDLEQNGRLCFVYTTLHEFDGYDAKSNSDIGSYTPYLVYPVTNSCRLNEPLTKKYNQEHYVFAGSNYDGKLRVLYPRKKGKYRLYKKQ